jgi:hypothetical protein
MGLRIRRIPPDPKPILARGRRNNGSLNVQRRLLTLGSCIEQLPGGAADFLLETRAQWRFVAAKEYFAVADYRFVAGRPQRFELRLGDRVASLQ